MGNYGNASGIYKITNLTNGKVYIGQSKNIYRRRKEHFIALRHGTHTNVQMQKDWNQNPNGFRWDVVELCDVKMLNAREKFWIDAYHSITRGYNQGWAPYHRSFTKVKLSSRKIKGYRKSR